MNKLTVLGNPIAHSLSPKIHTAFAKQCGIVLSYDTTLVVPDALANTFSSLKKSHLGCNITAPFKTSAFEIADELTDQALQAQAVNTFKFIDKKIFGHNTDGLGLITDLTQRLQCDLAHKNILLLGAGGAARGCLAPLLQQQPKQVSIINRTHETAAELAKTFHSIGNVCALKETDKAFDLIINTAHANLTAEDLALNAQWLTEKTLCYDLNYYDNSCFLRWAEQHGAKTSNGLGMLVEQAAESFYFWFGVKPQTNNIFTSLNKHLSS